MEGRPEAKAGGDTKGRETGGEPLFHSLSIHTMSAGRCKPAGMEGKQSSRGDRDLVLRITGCQLQMIHSLHQPNSICFETE